MFFDFTEREKDGAGDMKSRAVGARTLLVERRKEEPMGMSGPLSRTVKLKTDRYIFLFLRVLTKFLLCPHSQQKISRQIHLQIIDCITTYHKAASLTLIHTQKERILSLFRSKKGKR
jgi:hypothetical protein